MCCLEGLYEENPFDGEFTGERSGAVAWVERWAAEALGCR
jgi:hypothetical protein